MKKILLVALVVLLVLFIGYEGCRRAQDSKQESIAVLDSLSRANDSLLALNAKADATIEQLRTTDSILLDQIDRQKVKIVKVTKFVDSSKKAIDTYSEKELISSFNKRYSADTVSNPLPLAQPVLVSAAKDLVELDGAKELLSIKDSVILLQEDIIATKDTVIGAYAFKEQNYIKITNNKDLEVKAWTIESNKLKSQNKRLILTSKLHRITSYVIIGGLSYLLLSK